MSSNCDTFDSTNMRELTVVYDGSCSVCNREINFYRRLNSDKAIRFVNAAALTYTGETIGVARDTALGLLHARSSDGRMFAGVDAFIEIWKRLPPLNKVSRLAQIGPIYHSLRLGYRAFLILRGNDTTSRANFRQLNPLIRRELTALYLLILKFEYRSRFRLLLWRERNRFAETRVVAIRKRQRRIIEQLISKKCCSASQRLLTHLLAFSGAAVDRLTVASVKGCEAAINAKATQVADAFAVQANSPGTGLDENQYVSQLRTAVQDLT